MSLGWKQEYESEALSDFTQAVRLIAMEHPEDAALQAFARKAQLTTIMVLTNEVRDLNKPGANCLRDRLDDCRECRARNESRPCHANGGHESCIYKSPAYALKAIEKYLGGNALDYVFKYIPKQEEST